MQAQTQTEPTTLLDLVVAVSAGTTREEETVRAVVSLLEDRRVRLVGEFLEQHLPLASPASPRIGFA